MPRFPSDFIWWTLIGVLAIECVVRFAIPFSLDRVLLAESVAFILAAATLSTIAGRKPSLSSRMRGVAFVLAIAFVLGAVRSALWLTGLEVQTANLTILLMGLILYGAWRLARKRRGPKTG